MKEIVEELTQLKKQIDQAKEHRAELMGREKELLNRLKNEFNVSSIEKAENLLEKLKTELITEQKIIETKFAEMKSQFEW